MPSGIDRVILSFPTRLSLAADVPSASTDHPKSWIQVARTGSFVSNRYGKFSITRDDLKQMVTNFRTVTPKAPTMLPVDYDHLSMDPKKPGDGMAAGWMQDLELRDDGETLWASVEWTPDGASAIKKRAYQFVSPSFVKDYVYKDGRDIGTTLLAAAITNHPFLEGMKALTLSAGLRELAHLNLADEKQPPTPPTAEAVEEKKGGTAMQVGQKVSVKDDEVQKPEQVGVTFDVRQVVGEGADAFVSLLAPDGSIAEWFRADELQPARVMVNATGVISPVSTTLPAMPSAVTTPIPTSMSSLPEVEGKSLMGDMPAVAKPAALPEVAGKQLAATLPEVEGAHLAATLPEVEGANLAATLPEVEGANLAAALPEIEGASLSSHNGVADTWASPKTVPPSQGLLAKRKNQAHPIPKNAQTGMTVSASQEKPMKTFQLNDQNGQVVTLSADQVKALVAQVAEAEGSVMVPATEHAALSQQVITLSNQVEIMATAAATAERENKLMQLRSELSKLSQAGRIDKKQRDWAEKHYGGPEVDLAGFAEWASAVPTEPIVRLNHEHGSALEGPGAAGSGAAAGQEILELAEELKNKDRKLTHRQAVINASRQMAERVDDYQEQFRTTVN